MTLHGYYRSSASFRVRIALNLKRLDIPQATHHLRRGEQRDPHFLDLNPQGLVPALETDDGVISQSLAIIEYLDEIHPAPPLLPTDAPGRARVRSLAQLIACDIHPIDNLRVLNYLRGPLGQSEDAVRAWFNHWIATGFDAFEKVLDSDLTGQFCHGDVPGLADICLVPQVTNAGNFDLDLAPYPRIRAIHAAAMALPEFERAKPGNQPDAE